MFVQYAAKRIHDVQLSLQYAQECYLSQKALTGMSSTCRILKASTVDLKPSRTGSCPFEPQKCHNAASPIVLDTGDIDSHHDLAINAKPGDQLRY